MRDIAHARVRHGHKRIQIVLRREGIHVNHKRVYRLHCEEGLQLSKNAPVGTLAPLTENRCRHEKPVSLTRPGA
ncbi:hypothetical protein C0039_10650 [Pseudohalioglobus lutimaris]|uniref:HTH-like domain-containing protein n=1 Tax=Pseudohalioglobus lutimaris TaxID=1737061 RepID=A0A2N5X2X2_9GAMM|nr:hypothetical protein C0039_10650 [Pseudohalioglobus lutimaris]